jgi:hypothetical protein
MLDNFQLPSVLIEPSEKESIENEEDIALET